jgi:hypothetical protein
VARHVKVVVAVSMLTGTMGACGADTQGLDFAASVVAFEFVGGAGTPNSDHLTSQLVLLNPGTGAFDVIDYAAWARAAVGVGDSWRATPVAINAEHQTMLVELTTLAYATPRLALVDLREEYGKPVAACAEAHAQGTGALTLLAAREDGWLMYGDCGEGFVTLVVDPISGEATQVASAPTQTDPWAWDADAARFVVVEGDYSWCRSGGRFDSGGLALLCGGPDMIGEAEAGIFIRGSDLTDGLPVIKGTLGPLAGGKVASWWFPGEFWAVGDRLVVNQATIEGDMMLVDGPQVDGAQVTAVAVVDGRVLLVNGTDAFGPRPSDGQVMLWWDPKTGERDIVGSLPLSTPEAPVRRVVQVPIG